MKYLTKNTKKIWWGLKSFGAIHYYGNPSKKLKVIGVTGTSGKTTTATLLYKIAMALGYKTGLIGTVENLIAGEKIATNAKGPSTTPDSVTLTKLFSKMLESGCEYVFMEVSSHALDQNRVAGVNFVGGIFTNLTQDHFDYHKNFENYFTAKKKFFNMLPARAFALTNADSVYGLKMLKGIKANPFSYGFLGEESKVHFHGEIKKLDFHGLDLLFNQIEVESKLLGKFNAYNLLAVWSACSLLGFDMSKVNKVLESVTPPSSRFEYFISKKGVIGVVDYAHKPDALENVISTARGIVEEAHKGGRVISVFGCSGDKDPLKRPIMGKIGANLSDFAIFTSDNPRSEEPANILEQMKPDLSPEEIKKIKIIVDRDEAIREVSKIAKENDIVLLMGKGHETYQDIKGVKYPWSEMDRLKKALQ
ncbi:MAG TPA: UDP-N-acetylmuramoyl-L-alanyl-D-glutamate--2,6-diaminopimelate ligase [Candidatus Paceibacterota bacterium]